MMRKRAVFLLIFLCLTGLVLSAEKPVQIRFPVRIFKGNQPLTRLKKEDFKLFINGRQREITNLIGREKSIGRKPDLGRYFILSFHITEYTRQFENGIVFFISEIVSPGDILIILSPVRIYQFHASANKEKMIREMTGKLKNDYYQYNKRRVSEEKKLLANIKKLKRIYADNSLHPGPYLGTIEFLDRFPLEYSNFTNSFLLPSIGKFRQIVDILEKKGGEGERWWIHFQVRDITILNYKLKEIINEINSYVTVRHQFDANARSRALKLKFDQFRNQLIFAGSFPGNQFLDTLMRGNISYNIIFLKGIKDIEADVMTTATTDMKKIQEEISTHSGGAAVKATRFEQGVLEIKDHVDHYYDLDFEFDGNINEKKITISLEDNIQDKGVSLIYKGSFKKEELESFIQDLSTENVKIIAFCQEGHIIRFSIGSYELAAERHPLMSRNGSARQKDSSKYKQSENSYTIKLQSKEQETFGLLTVRIEILDEQGVTAFKSEKTLRASKDKLGISLPLPLELRGELELSITVSDLIANRTAFLSRKITL